LKILLCSSPDVQPDFDFVGRAPNLGIASIAGNVNDVCKVDIADLHALPMHRPDFVERWVLSTVRHGGYDLVGLSAMTFQYPGIMKMARALKRETGVEIALGGYHPTLMHREISGSPDADYVDYIVRGEGEATFRQLVRSLGGNGDLSGVKGLSWKDRRGFHHNGARALLDLKQVRLPDRGSRLITRGLEVYGHRSDAVETSRGCVQGCKFCSINQMYGRSFRRYEIERVIEDISDARARGAEGILFTDDNITLDMKRIGILCDAIVEAGLDDVSYGVQASTSGIASDPEVVRKMARAGVRGVFLGIESPKAETLEFFNKSSMASQAQRAVQNLHDNNIISMGGFIVGNPTDRMEDIWNNFRFARHLKIDIPVFFILTPYPKTELAKELEERGLIVDRDWSHYDAVYAVCDTEHLRAEEVQRVVWDMATAYYDLYWYSFNKIRRFAPAHFWKQALRLFPRYLLRRLELRLGLLKPEDLLRRDVKTGILYKGYS